jgi:hypothetical protein
MAKVTMKEKVLQFVESKGTASFTEIQRFIVDTKFGEGTYDGDKGKDHRYNLKTGKHDIPTNPWRGYFCAALTKGRTAEHYPYYAKREGYFLVGENRLVKGTDGKYTVVRNG